MDARVEFLGALRMSPASRWRSALSITSMRILRWRVKRTPRLVRASCKRPGRSWALIRSPVETRCAVVDMIAVRAAALTLKVTARPRENILAVRASGAESAAERHCT